MSQEAKTYQQLIDQYPDNTEGLITPERLRDFVESIRLPYGQVYRVWDHNAVRVIEDAAFAWTKLGGDTTLAGQVHLMDDDGETDNRLRYTGTITRPFLVIARFTGYIDPRQRIHLGVMKNGSDPAANLIASFDSGGLGEFESFSVEVSGIVELGQNDYLEVGVFPRDTTDPDFYAETHSLTTYGLFV